MPLPHILVNSNFTQKHIVDADKIMDNFQYVLDQIGETPLQNLITATGQVYNKLNAEQLVTAIVQLVLAGQYFVDESSSANNIILSPVVSSYSVPATYVNNMEFLFSPTYTNTGGVTILFKGLDSTAYTKKLLDRAGNELVASTIVSGTTYAAHYDAARDSFILGSLRNGAGSGADTDIFLFIENVVESLGITFSESSTSQLVKSIAEYCLLNSYKDISTYADMNNQVYRIKPYNEEGTAVVTLATPFEYYNGMTIRFSPVFSNTTSIPSIMIDTLDAIPVKNSDGSVLSEGDIRQGIDTIVRYVNGSFYLISNKLNKLSLYNGLTVDTIEETVTDNNSSLPTSAAVYNALENTKNMVTNLGRGKSFCVIEGPTEHNDQTYITLDDTTVYLLEGTKVLYPDYTYEAISSEYSLDISSITGSFKVLYVKDQGLKVIPSSNYTESFSIPSTAGTDGDAFVYVDSFGRITTYIYSSEDAEWVETPFVKVAFGEESSGSYSLEVPPLCGKYVVETTIPTSSLSTTITHNFDSLCAAKVLLVCTSSDLAYNVGDTIELGSFITSSSFLTIGSTNTQTVISTSGILLPDSGGTPSAIDDSKWKLNVTITRVF